jgi:hypothetical protein
VSLGFYSAGASSGVWDQTDTTQLHNEIDGFRAFYSQSTLYNDVGVGQAIAEAQATNNFQVPYTPTATVFQHITWQANDPLVHYTAGDLQGAPGNGLDKTFSWPANLGQLNDRYFPWGGNPSKPTSDQYPYNFGIKDPLIYDSDDWDFPTNKFPTVGWLGRVHRGTPWQTVYLKASDVLSFATGSANYGTNLWVGWTGNVNPFDAANTAPVQDRLLFDIFTTAFNDNATRGTLSVNQSHLAAWSGLFSGVMALSSNAPNGAVQAAKQTATSLTNFTAFPISPAGPGTNSAMWQLWNGIAQTRAAVSNIDGVVGVFEHAGHILSVPQLTEQSPFLNWNNPNQQKYGINDEMYEWLPQQVMSLLREGSPRYVIYCYGQALKPAPNSLVTGGTYFGMCTNYQVVAESAARAVVRVDGATTPAPHVVVESYNLLPPD